MTRTMPRFGIGRRTILVADRSAIIRTVVREILIRQGYRVLTAATAEDATKIVSRLSRRLYAIVAESISPGTGGEEVCGELSRLAPAVPLLAMINPQPRISNQRDARLYSAPVEKVNVIVKPFTQALLLSKLEELVAVQPARETSVQPTRYKTASLAS